MTMKRFPFTRCLNFINSKKKGKENIYEHGTYCVFKKLSLKSCTNLLHSCSKVSDLSIF